MGEDAENLFTTYADKNGYYASKQFGQINIEQHIDYLLYKHIGAKPISIDVKSQKRQYKISQPNKTVIELKNVRGEIGWLYGNADKIAFQYETSFLIFDRKELVSFTEKYLAESKPEIITRNKRKDEFFWIDFIVLKEKLPHEEWAKE